MKEQRVGVGEWRDAEQCWTKGSELFIRSHRNKAHMNLFV